MIDRVYSALVKSIAIPTYSERSELEYPLPTLNAWSRFKRYSGVGFLIAVGYMDPGNWATDIAAGSRFGYGLLSIVLLSCFAAMILQTLCVRLAVATGKDLAELCREQFAPRYYVPLWLLAQGAIIACDFAEVLGTALALQLLFGLPLTVGIPLTAFDTLIILWLQGRSVLRVETIVITLVTLIAVIFAIEIFMSKPDVSQILSNLIPSPEIFKQPGALALAIGIIGATVMPHNLYLHTAVVSTRVKEAKQLSKHEAIRLFTWNTVATLSLALFINSSILIVSASVFHFSGYHNVTEINDAYFLLTPLLGATLASILFGIALFASGQSSTLTGTLAGQVILQGFLRMNIPAWKQRLATRMTSLLPAWLLIIIYGEDSLGTLLVWSQIILSLQLPFAMAPLIWFNCRSSLMGRWQLPFSGRVICWIICLIIIVADLWLLLTFF